jgi:hypothetical protein
VNKRTTGALSASALYISPEALRRSLAFLAKIVDALRDGAKEQTVDTELADIKIVKIAERIFVFLSCIPPYRDLGT